VVAYYTLMIRLFSALSLAAAFTLQGSPGADGWPRIASLYHQRLQETGIVGSSLMFVKDGAIAHQAFEGYQDRATKRSVDEETIYHWASITKTFTGIPIMQLRDRGLLSLDDPAVKYVPGAVRAKAAKKRTGTTKRAPKRRSASRRR
jgi:CubicO group peptidase (beta-lactamase class C family)